MVDSAHLDVGRVFGKMDVTLVMDILAKSNGRWPSLNEKNGCKCSHWPSMAEITLVRNSYRTLAEWTLAEYYLYVYILVFTYHFDFM